MTMKVNRSVLILGILGLLVGLFFAGRLSTRQERLALQSQTSQSKDSITYFKAKINGLTYDVAQKNSIITTQRQAIDAGLISKEEMRKLYLKTIEYKLKLESRIEVLLDSIKNDATVIYVPISGDTVPCAVLPFTFEKKNEFISLNGVADVSKFENKNLVVSAKGNDKLNLSMDLTMPISLDVVIGTKRKGLPIVSVLEKSPYVTITGINSVKIVENKKWYDSKWIPFGAGVVGTSAFFLLVK